MGIYRLKLPDLGEGVVESEIVTWRVAPGDKVVEDQPVVDVMTDKAVVEVGSPVNGVVLSLACEQGEMLGVGQELIRFEIAGKGNVDESKVDTQHTDTQDLDTPNTAAEQAKAPAAAETAAAIEQPEPAIAARPETKAERTPVAPQQRPAATPPGGEIIQPLFPHRSVLTSPSVRRLAREHGVDLSMVPGSGPDGRIEHSDIETFIAAGAQSFGRAPLRRRNGATTMKINGLRRVIARKIAAAKRDIPHYSYIEEVDLTDLEKLRDELNAERRPHHPKLTLLPFVMRALVNVLPDFPHCNATYDDAGEQLTQYGAVHIGVATMTDQGLAVPVVRHSEALDLWQTAAEIARLAEATRNRSAAREELTGSTITVTSLGPLGGLASTPIINAPETAIIGINKLQQRPVVIDGRIVVRTMMNLSASFDHRIVDGYDGARLVQALKRQLESPARLFL